MIEWEHDQKCAIFSVIGYLPFDVCQYPILKDLSPLSQLDQLSGIRLFRLLEPYP